MKRLIQLIETSRYVVVFTGAGVSTFSGVRDFRGKNGLYKDQRVDTNKLFDLRWFHKDPSIYYTMSRDFIYDLDEKAPSIVHKTLAAMERRGLIRAVVTQNIDLLHQKAGAKAVIEIHGSPSRHHCLECGREYTFEETKEKMATAVVPRCECKGVLKPDITFFGEMLPEKAIEQAVAACARADLTLVLGSTLVVQPAASLPLYTLRSGGSIVIVNDMETPLDNAAVLRYPDLEAVATALFEAFND